MYGSLQEIINQTKESEKPFWQVVQEEDCREEAIAEVDSYYRMGKMYAAMRDSDRNYDPGLKSASGLVGTEAEKIHNRRMEKKLLSGDFIGRIMERALRVAESNACMKRIVAAPTAGSCGVVPAVLLTMQEERKIPEEEMIHALYVAAGVGGVIAVRASLSGAEGGMPGGDRFCLRDGSRRRCLPSWRRCRNHFPRIRHCSQRASRAHL